MITLFSDESEGQINGGEFTSITVVEFSSANLICFRDQFFREASELERLFQNRDKAVISDIPILHGVDLLREYSDPQKFNYLDKFLNSLVENCGRIFRLGYFNKTIQMFCETEGNETLSRQKRVHFCLMNFWMMYRPPVGQQFMLVHELDATATLRSTQFSNLDQGQGFSKLHQIEQANLSVDLDNFLGHYYAPKSEIGCQAADICSYLAGKKENAPATSFGKKLSERFDLIENKFFYNQIVEMKLNGESQL